MLVASVCQPSNQNLSANFGAIVKTEKAVKYLNRLPYDKSIEVKVMEMDSRHKKLDVYVDTIMKNGKERLKADIGTKSFIESVIKNPVKTLRKAVNYANKLEQEQNIQYELTKGMNRPNLG